MLPQDVIRAKRDGATLTESQIGFFIKGVADKTVAEAQVSAFCMAVFFQKMTLPERVALTAAMARSGTVLDWAGLNLPGPVLDKHSTGGVGDKTSLMLAPIIAACGGFVPMISGRGLGHTGGTLDKMDSIAGYRSQPDLDLLRTTVRTAGCAIIGATPDLAPADRVMYAVRDVTATVESLDLITASILSKKLAAGLSGLVMDVKFGSGAFMRDYADAKTLAQSITHVANGAGLKTTALLTDMNQVLGRTAGNALEVLEAVEYLKGTVREPRLHAVTVALCAELLVLGGLAPSLAAAEAKIEAALASGHAAERFSAMVAALGGPADFIDNPRKYMSAAPVQRDVVLGGTVSSMDVFKIGMGIVALGGGRTRPSDGIDHAVGLSAVAGVGEPARFTVHARDEAGFEAMAGVLRAAVVCDGAPVQDQQDQLIRERITA